MKVMPHASKLAAEFFEISRACLGKLVPPLWFKRKYNLDICRSSGMSSAPLLKCKVAVV
jgi:hypothetical protein